MKRHHLIPSLAALTLAFALPAMASATTSTKSTKSASAKTSTTHHHTSNASAKKSHKIDLNSASREELMTLPGVDGATADKIIAGRPYKSMDQLVSKNVMSKSEYGKVKSHVSAKQPAMHSEAPASQ